MVPERIVAAHLRVIQRRHDRRGTASGKSQCRAPWAAGLFNSLYPPPVLCLQPRSHSNYSQETMRCSPGITTHPLSRRQRSVPRSAPPTKNLRPRASPRVSTYAARSCVHRCGRGATCFTDAGGWKSGRRFGNTASRRSREDTGTSVRRATRSGTSCGKSLTKRLSVDFAPLKRAPLSACIA